MFDKLYPYFVYQWNKKMNANILYLECFFWWKFGIVVMEKTMTLNDKANGLWLTADWKITTLKLYTYSG